MRGQDHSTLVASTKAYLCFIESESEDRNCKSCENSSIEKGKRKCSIISGHCEFEVEDTTVCLKHNR